MDDPLQQNLRAAEQAVSRLVECCALSQRLPRRVPRAVAQVGRTGRWLLHAVAALRRHLQTPDAGPTQPS